MFKNMSKNISRFLNIYFIIILLPSCSRINNLIDKHFFEGCRPCPYFAKAHDYMRTIKLYDQLSTVGIFTALWISKDVINAYKKAYNQQRNLPLDQDLDQALIQDSFLLKNKQNNLIYFYVIGYQPEIEGNIFNVCNDNDSRWHISLKIDEQIFKPKKITPVKVDRIIEKMLKPYHNRFNELYEVEFDLNYLIDLNFNEHVMQMTFSCLESFGTIKWDIFEGRAVKSNCPAYRICRDCCFEKIII